jgi:diaminohydroxyphosphoribosylaminopyrimidine deaminase/5-amino-6-(5-phosphoribosylamino)uracil reductase
LIKKILKELHKQNIQSFKIEGGSITLQSFIDANIWDEARIFTANKLLSQGLKTPIIEGKIILERKIGTDTLEIITNR